MKKNEYPVLTQDYRKKYMEEMYINKLDTTIYCTDCKWCKRKIIPITFVSVFRLLWLKWLRFDYYCYNPYFRYLDFVAKTGSSHSCHEERTIYKCTMHAYGFEPKDEQK